MEEISGEDFKARIKNNENYFTDITINVDKLISIEINLLNKSLVFKNVVFNGKKISFEGIKDGEINKNISFDFEDCSFFCDVVFSCCNVHSFTFVSCIINNQSFQIKHCKAYYISFEENSNDLSNVKPNIVKSGDIKIISGEINAIEFENIQFIDSALNIKGLKSLNIFTIVKSTLNNITISNCHVSNYFDYIGNDVVINENNNFFSHCTFNRSSFSKTKFNNKTHFNNCTFSEIANFQSIDNKTIGAFKFTNCNFKKFTDFDRSKIQKIRFEKTTFQDYVSFQETYFDIIEIDKTNFEKGAFFDDIQIKNINDCDKRTIRTIKQQLQKAENRIDYNRFRNYELAAHYKELDWKWNSGFIDKSILFVTKISTDFGNSWRKALRFTILGGFSIYFLLYIIENSHYTIDLSNWDNWARLFSGFFRFLLVTDFYNPLETERIYLINPFSWLIFIFGKIVIAFGIYEMIQSFRKFKA